MQKYSRLTREERYQIEALLRSGLSLRKIAKQLGRNPSTLSREIKDRSTYRAKKADQHSQRLRRFPHPELRKIQGYLETQVREKILEDWSPEQIAQRLPMISYQTIYRYCLRDKENKGKLWKHLRILRKQRKDKMPRWKPTRLENRVMIEERPKIVEERKRLGDYERDTVLGKVNGNFLLTIVDRTSRMTKLALIRKKSAQHVHRATVKLLKDLPRHTITNDNGTEFSHHRQTAKDLDLKIYFSNPYRAWERGSNENLNGLLRQYFPKKKSIGSLTQKEIQRIEDRLNNRPRKCLGFKTPLEIQRFLTATPLR